MVLNFAITVHMRLSHSNFFLGGGNNSKVHLVSAVGFCFTQTKTNGIFHYTDSIQFVLRAIALDIVTNRWRHHNNKTTKISELNNIIKLYEL